MAGPFTLQAVLSPVMTSVVPSLKVAMACSDWLAPTDRNRAAGLMVRPTTAGRVTVRFALPVTDPMVAVMLETPVSTPVAKPPGVIVAAAQTVEFQASEEEEVRGCVLPSV